MYVYVYIYIYIYVYIYVYIYIYIYIYIYTDFLSSIVRISPKFTSTGWTIKRQNALR